MTERELYKVEGHPNLRKDPRTGAVLLVNKEQADEYMLKKKATQSTRELETRMNVMEESIDEIKNMLKVLLTSK